jgi:hypothetical protein
VTLYPATNQLGQVDACSSECKSTRKIVSWRMHTSKLEKMHIICPRFCEVFSTRMGGAFIYGNVKHALCTFINTVMSLLNTLGRHICVVHVACSLLHYVLFSAIYIITINNKWGPFKYLRTLPLLSRAQMLPSVIEHDKRECASRVRMPKQHK